MKKILLLTAALIGGIALPTLLMAGPTENITGCATAPAEGSNFTVRVDPTCALAETGGSGGDAFILAGLAAVIEDLAEEE